MHPNVSRLLPLLTLIPSLAVAEPPTLAATVVNGPDAPVPVQGAVAVTTLPRDRGADLLDLSVNCIGALPSFQCDASWQGSVLIESLSAHCQGSTGAVHLVKVITSIAATAPSVPASGVTASAGPGATSATAFEGARRFIPLNLLPSLNPTLLVTGVTPTPTRALVPADRFVRIVLEGEGTGSASCFVAFSGRWLD